MVTKKTAKQAGKGVAAKAVAKKAASARHKAIARGEIGHVNDDTFEAELRRKGLPMLVDFSATWCTPCEWMAKVLRRLGRKLADEVRIVKVDIDESPRLDRAFAHGTVPTLVLFRSGKAAARAVGFDGQTETEEWLREALDAEASRRKGPPTCCCG